MAVDKMVDSGVLNGALGEIADAIRAKAGISGTLAFPDPNDFADAIDEYLIRPTGTKSITQNGTNIDVAQYSKVDVNVSGGGGGGQKKTGTFTGTGAISVTIPCDFEPDVVYVFGNLSEDVTLIGMKYCVVIRDCIVITGYDNSTSNSNATYSSQGSISGLNSNHSVNYVTYATYNSGTKAVTISNHNNAARVYYNSNVEYTYLLAKYT